MRITVIKFPPRKEEVLYVKKGATVREALGDWCVRNKREMRMGRTAFKRNCVEEIYPKTVLNAGDRIVVYKPMSGTGPATPAFRNHINRNLRRWEMGFQVPKLDSYEGRVMSGI